MPAWFSILAKIMSMISLLLPVIEQQFGSDAGSGAAKKQALLGKVDDYLARQDLRDQHPSLTDKHIEAVRELAEGYIDNAVAATNYVEAWPTPEPAAAPAADDVPTHHGVDNESAHDRQPWELAADRARRGASRR